MRCDGIWDVLTSQEEVTELALEASRLNTFDNVSGVVVCFLSADEMVTTAPPVEKQRCCSLTAEAF